MISLWGIEVSEKKPVTVCPPEGLVLNVQTVALSCNQTTPHEVRVRSTNVHTGKEQNILLCTLEKQRTDQFKLDLVVGSGNEVTFSVTGGTGKVYFSGYFQPGPAYDEDYDSSDDECIEDFSQEDLDAMKKRMIPIMKQIDDEQEVSSEEDDQVDSEDGDSDVRDGSSEDVVDSKSQKKATSKSAKQSNKKKSEEIKKEVVPAKKRPNAPISENTPSKKQKKKANAEKAPVSAVTWDQEDSSSDEDTQVSKKKATKAQIGDESQQKSETPKKKKNRKRNKRKTES